MKSRRRSLKVFDSAEAKKGVFKMRLPKAHHRLHIIIQIDRKQET